jgi:hypothetical protein
MDFFESSVCDAFTLTIVFLSGVLLTVLSIENVVSCSDSKVGIGVVKPSSRGISSASAGKEGCC